MIRALPGLLLLATLADAAAAQPARVKDINTTDFSGSYTFRSEMARSGNVLYFAFDDGIHGTELWRTDGTAGNTRLVKDICPGACPSSPVWLTAIGPDVLYFSADDGAHGREIWRTTGSEPGTELFRDGLPGLQDGGAAYLFELNGRLVFRARKTEGGYALWASDGTEAGTTVLKDLCSGCYLAFPMGRLGSSMLLGLEDSVWKTDGTAAGTVLVRDVAPAEPNPDLPGHLTYVLFGGRLLFSADDGLAGHELWATDGTETGTVLVKDVNPGAPSANLRGLVALDDGILFAASDAVHGNGLWKSDGTEGGTVRVKSFYAAELTRMGSAVYFRASDPAHGYELWRSDGTEAGTVLVKDTRPGTVSGGMVPFGPFGFQAVADRLFFFSNDGVHGLEPWVSDGTEAGTNMLAELTPTDIDLDSPFLDIVADLRQVMGGLLYFRFPDAEGNLELHATDGTAEGTGQLGDNRHQASGILIDGRHLGTLWGSGTLADWNGTLFLQASDEVSRPELWKSDGTAAGTEKVADLPAQPRSLTPLGSKLLFEAGQLWLSDGTPPGTAQLGDQGSGGLTRAGANAYFESRTGNLDGLYKTDGTLPGTVLLHSSPWIDRLSAFGNLLLFASQDVLWRTDGTPAGTFQLGAASPGPFRKVGNRAFFSAEDATAGRELWITDGTVAGTIRVKDLNPGPAAGILTSPYSTLWPAESWADLDGRYLLFPADGGTGDGEELWISDGTASGTFQLADLNPGSGSSEVRWLTGAGRKVYFVADDAAHGRELWITNGTLAGTRRITDLVPGAASSLPEQLHPEGTQLLFSAFTPDAGREPWITDGDAVGTRLLADLAPGVLPSTPQAFTPSGSRVYFVATDAETGFELYAVPRSEVDGSMDLYTVPPCRLVDTRQSGGPLTPNVPRTVDAAGHCGIPATARALAVNVTAIGLAGQGSVTLFRADTQPPSTNTVGVAAGQNRAAGTMVLLGDGAVAAVARPETLSVHLIVDVTGYYE